MCVKLPPEDLNLSSSSHNLQAFNIYEITIVPRVCGDPNIYLNTHL